MTHHHQDLAQDQPPQGQPLGGGGKGGSARGGNLPATLQALGLYRSQLAEVWGAWRENPGRVERLAEAALKDAARNPHLKPAPIFLTDLRSGFDPPAKAVTGWRWVRGTHSGTYVADPQGTDPLPPGYGR